MLVVTNYTMNNGQWVELGEILVPFDNIINAVAAKRKDTTTLFDCTTLYVRGVDKQKEFFIKESPGDLERIRINQLREEKFLLGGLSKS